MPGPVRIFVDPGAANATVCADEAPGRAEAATKRTKAKSGRYLIVYLDPVFVVAPTRPDSL